MPAIKYRVDLTEDERVQLHALTHKGTSGARSHNRARILLKADEGLHDDEVARALDVGINTVARVRRRFVEGGLERALKDGPRPGAVPKLDARQCAHEFKAPEPIRHRVVLAAFEHQRAEPTPREPRMNEERANLRGVLGGIQFGGVPIGARVAAEQGAPPAPPTAAGQLAVDFDDEVGPVANELGVGAERAA